MPRAKYPHILPVDVPVWERFLAAHAQDYRHVDYDVRVGTGRDPGDSFAPNIRQMALDLSMRRIDAVGHAPAHLDIIELTTTAGLKALGQLSAYPHLYRATYRPALPLRAVLVCQDFETDCEGPWLESGHLIFRV